MHICVEHLDGLWFVVLENLKCTGLGLVNSHGSQRFLHDPSEYGIILNNLFFSLLQNDDTEVYCSNIDILTGK